MLKVSYDDGALELVENPGVKNSDHDMVNSDEGSQQDKEAIIHYSVSNIALRAAFVS